MCRVNVSKEDITNSHLVDIDLSSWIDLTFAYIFVLIKSVKRLKSVLVEVEYILKVKYIIKITKQK